MMESQLTIATYSAASEIQPVQLARLLNELEALADRARQIIKPVAFSDCHEKKAIDGKLGLPVTQEMLLDESIRFDFSKFSD